MILLCEARDLLYTARELLEDTLPYRQPAWSWCVLGKAVSMGILNRGEETQVANLMREHPPRLSWWDDLQMQDGANALSGITVNCNPRYQSMTHRATLSGTC